MPDPGNVARGYRASLKNRNVSEQAKKHAEEELHKIESDQSGEEDTHTRNVKRGLKAATHNPNVTDSGKKAARDKLNKLGGEVEEPED